MYKIFNFTHSTNCYGTSENLFPTKSEILIIYFMKKKRSLVINLLWRLVLADWNLCIHAASMGTASSPDSYDCLITRHAFGIPVVSPAFHMLICFYFPCFSNHAHVLILSRRCSPAVSPVPLILKCFSPPLAWCLWVLGVGVPSHMPTGSDYPIVTYSLHFDYCGSL